MGFYANASNPSSYECLGAKRNDWDSRAIQTDCSTWLVKGKNMSDGN